MAQHALYCNTLAFFIASEPKLQRYRDLNHKITCRIYIVCDNLRHSRRSDDE